MQDTAQSHSSMVSSVSGCSARNAEISLFMPIFRGINPPPSARRWGNRIFIFSTHSWVYSLVQWEGRGKRRFFFFFFLAGASGICVSTADEFIPTGADSAACSVNADSIISVFSDKEGNEKVRRFFTTMTGIFLSSWFFSINTSAGWFYSLIISQSIN